MNNDKQKAPERRPGLCTQRALLGHPCFWVDIITILYTEAKGWVGRNIVTYKGVKALARALQANAELTKLSLARNMLGEAGTKSICEAHKSLANKSS